MKESALVIMQINIFLHSFAASFPLGFENKRAKWD